MCGGVQWFAKAKRQAELAWNRGMSAKYDVSAVRLEPPASRSETPASSLPSWNRTGEASGATTDG